MGCHSAYHVILSQVQTVQSFNYSTGTSIGDNVDCYLLSQASSGLQLSGSRVRALTGYSPSFINSQHFYINVQHFTAFISMFSPSALRPSGSFISECSDFDSLAKNAYVASLKPANLKLYMSQTKSLVPQLQCLLFQRGLEHPALST